MRPEKFLSVKTSFGISIFRQGLAFGFWRPDQRHHANEVNRTHEHRHGAERHPSAEVAEQERKRGGHLSTRMPFRTVAVLMCSITRETVAGAEAHEGQHPVD